MYYVRARLFPTILTIAPLLIIANTVVNKLLYDSLEEVFSILPIIVDLGLSSALLFFMIQVNRFMAKEVFQRFYFQEEIRMPTTNHLLWKNEFFDPSIKNKIRDKVSSKFGLTLMSAEEEKVNEPAARKQIVTVVSQIRNSLRDNKLLLQHNIEYGFFRNLLGGCLIAILFSIGIFFYGIILEKNSMIISGIAFSILYGSPIFLSKTIINRYGNYYSKILYEQFLSI